MLYKAFQIKHKFKPEKLIIRALFNAVKEGNQGVVTDLIKEVADVNVKYEDGKTALMLAVEHSSCLAVKTSENSPGL